MQDRLAKLASALQLDDEEEENDADADEEEAEEDQEAVDVLDIESRWPTHKKQPTMKSFAKTVNPDATRVSAKQLQKEVKTMTTASTKPFYADLEHSTIIIFSEKQMTDPLTLHQYDITRLFPAMVEHFTLKGVRDNLSGNNLMIMKEIKYTCRDQLKDYIHHVLESFELFQAASDVRKAHKDCALAKRACELSPAVSTVWPARISRCSPASWTASASLFYMALRSPNRSTQSSRRTTLRCRSG